jgi:dTMP kinase
LTSPGIFIVLEGPDGSGKTVQTGRLGMRFCKAGRVAFHHREPTEGPIGSLIRKALIGDVHLAPDAMGLLFAADRLDHAESIRHQLALGYVVVCDRYSLSNTVYRAAETEGPLYVCKACQWTGEPGEVLRIGLESWSTPRMCPSCQHYLVSISPFVLERAHWARSLSAGAPSPDLTVVLSVPSQISKERRKTRAGSAELYDQDRMQARCCALYARAEELVEDGERVVVIDGSGEVEEVAGRVWAAVAGVAEVVERKG